MLRRLINSFRSRSVRLSGFRSSVIASTASSGPSGLPANARRTGGRAWKVNGAFHRDNGPARLRSDGTQEWYRRGLRHRVDGPAVVRPDGMVEWFFDGRPHRVTGPAVLFPDGTLRWFHNGSDFSDVMAQLLGRLAAGATVMERLPALQHGAARIQLMRVDGMRVSAPIEVRCDGWLGWIDANAAKIAPAYALARTEAEARARARLTFDTKPMMYDSQIPGEMHEAADGRLVQTL
jgi:hypothetical protein